MKKSDSPLRSRRSTTGGMTLGRKRFAKISAVEGIELTADMRARAAEFERRGMVAEERRRSIIRAHNKV
jgi:hypothetical protein